MRIIDAHVHTLDNYEPMAPFGGMGRYDRLIELMDDAGVEKALMLPVVQPFSPENNAECAAWARQHPDRLATLTDVPAARPPASPSPTRRHTGEGPDRRARPRGRPSGGLHRPARALRAGEVRVLGASELAQVAVGVG